MDIWNVICHSKENGEVKYAELCIETPLLSFSQDNVFGLERECDFAGGFTSCNA